MISGLKILITGGSGFIGNYLINKLVALVNDVYVFDVDLPRREGTAEKVKKYITGSVLNKGDIDKLKEYTFDIIFHLAANASVPISVEDPELDFEINAVGTLNMLQFARKAGVKKFIYPSTVSIFDPSNKLPLSEKSMIKVSSPYGASKLTGESYCYAFHRSYGVDINIVRIFNVYGPGMRKHFIYDIIKKLHVARNKIDILGDGEQIRDYLYVEDVVDGMLLIAKKGLPGEDYNLCSGEKTKILDVIILIQKLMGKENISVVPSKRTWSGDITRWYGEMTKIQKLGFKPKVKLENGLIKTIKEIIKDE